MFISIYRLRFIKIFILEYYKREFKSALTILLFGNSKNFSKVDTIEINQNVIIAKQHKIQVC